LLSGDAHRLVEAVHHLRMNIARHECLVQLALLSLLPLVTLALLVHFLHFSVADDLVEILRA
jgi:hypothetical protein